MKLRNVRIAVTQGLVTHRVLGRLKRMGIGIEPFYLFQEGSVPEHALCELPEFEVTRLVSADAALLARCRPRENEQARNEERFASGHLCIALKHHGEIAAFTWANPHEIDDPACPARLAEHEAYLYDAYALPEYRGLGLAPLMRSRCYDALRAAGTKSFISISAYFNTPAIRFKRKLGAQAVMLYLSLELAGRPIGVWTLWNARRRQPACDRGTPQA